MNKNEAINKMCRLYFCDWAEAIYQHIQELENGSYDFSPMDRGTLKKTRQILQNVGAEMESETPFWNMDKEDLRQTVNNLENIAWCISDADESKEWAYRAASMIETLFAMNKGKFIRLHLN